VIEAVVAKTTHKLQQPDAKAVVRELHCFRLLVLAALLLSESDV